MPTSSQALILHRANSKRCNGSVANRMPLPVSTVTFCWNAKSGSLDQLPKLPKPAFPNHVRSLAQQHELGVGRTRKGRSPTCEKWRQGMLPRAISEPVFTRGFGFNVVKRASSPKFNDESLLKLEDISTSDASDLSEDVKKTMADIAKWIQQDECHHLKNECQDDQPSCFCEEQDIQSEDVLRKTLKRLEDLGFRRSSIKDLKTRSLRSWMVDVKHQPPPQYILTQCLKEKSFKNPPPHSAKNPPPRKCKQKSSSDPVDVKSKSKIQGPVTNFHSHLASDTTEAIHNFQPLLPDQIPSLDAEVLAELKEKVKELVEKNGSEVLPEAEDLLHLEFSNIEQMLMTIMEGHLRMNDSSPPAPPASRKMSAVSINLDSKASSTSIPCYPSNPCNPSSPCNPSIPCNPFLCFKVRNCKHGQSDMKAFLEGSMSVKLATLELDPYCQSMDFPFSDGLSNYCLWIFSLEDKSKTKAIQKRGIEIEGQLLPIRFYDEQIQKEQAANCLLKRIEEELVQTNAVNARMKKYPTRASLSPRSKARAARKKLERSPKGFNRVGGKVPGKK